MCGRPSRKWRVNISQVYLSCGHGKSIAKVSTEAPCWVAVDLRSLRVWSSIIVRCVKLKLSKWRGVLEMLQCHSTWISDGPGEYQDSQSTLVEWFVCWAIFQPPIASWAPRLKDSSSTELPSREREPLTN